MENTLHQFHEWGASGISDFYLFFRLSVTTKYNESIVRVDRRMKAITMITRKWSFLTDINCHLWTERTKSIYRVFRKSLRPIWLLLISLISSSTFVYQIWKMVRSGKYPHNIDLPSYKNPCFSHGFERCSGYLFLTTHTIRGSKMFY